MGQEKKIDEGISVELSSMGKTVIVTGCQQPCMSSLLLLFLIFAGSIVRHLTSMICLVIRLSYGALRVVEG